MLRVVNVYEAKTRLSELVERAARGEEIVIAKAGTPKARLMPLPAANSPRVPGGWEGQIWVSGDFDEPLPPDVLAGFGGEAEN
ncbi:MAG: type II toxin-antitoxin system prevent-host-death family antitoxin [Gemmatimonadales bacterium]|jgi:prevent-host-death family protein